MAPYSKYMNYLPQEKDKIIYHGNIYAHRHQRSNNGSVNKNLTMTTKAMSLSSCEISSMKNYPTLAGDNPSQSDTHPDQNNRPSQQSEMQGNKNKKECDMANLPQFNE